MLKRMYLLLVFAALLSGCGIWWQNNTAVETVAERENVALQQVVTSFIQERWPGAAVTVAVDDDSRVTLEGTVGSEEERQAIDDSAQGVDGVKRVRNRLHVSGLD